MVFMLYGERVVVDFEELAKPLTADAVASPLRSTMPFIDFWRTPESRLAELSAAIGVALDPPIDLRFEFPCFQLHDFVQECRIAQGRTNVYLHAGRPE
jgi:hypothetical protein